MRKLVVLAAAIALTALYAVPAQAQGYLAPKVFWSHLEGDAGFDLGKYNDNAAGGALAAGYDFYNGGFDAPLRFELEAAFRADATHDERYTLEGIGVSEKYEVGVTSIFANAYYDFHNTTDFTPYFGGGLGAARIKGTVTAKAAGERLSLKASNWDFAWNVGAGVAYNFTDKVALDLGYRYADFGTLTVSDVDLLDVTGHEVLLGGRFSF